MKLSITEAGVNADDVAGEVEKLTPYIEHLNEVAEAVNFEAPESSINLPSDLALREVVLALHQELEEGTLKYIFLIGIGGSNLGTKAIYDAFFSYEDMLNKERAPKIIFVDTNNGNRNK